MLASRNYDRGDYYHSLISCAYDYRNVRVEKKLQATPLGADVNDVTTYFVDGGRILGETKQTKENEISHRYYFYDAEGIAGIRLDGRNYNLLRDAQGNVCKVMYRNKLVGEYEYDAFGNCTMTILDSLDGAAVRGNPFRWKGYYWDEDLEFYVIYQNGKTRYYDPVLMMFLDAEEASEIDPYSIGGLDRNSLGVPNPLLFPVNSDNIFTSLPLFSNESGIVTNNAGGSGKSNSSGGRKYKLNLPTKEQWDDLHWGWKVAMGAGIITGLAVATAVSGGHPILAGATLGAIGGAIGAGISTVISGGSWDDFGNSLVIGIAVGAVSGAIGATGMGLSGQIAVNAVLGIGEYVAVTRLNGGDVTAGGLVASAFLGGAAGGIGAKSTSVFKDILYEIGGSILLGGIISGTYDKYITKQFNPQGNFWGW